MSQISMKIGRLLSPSGILYRGHQRATRWFVIYRGMDAKGPPIGREQHIVFGDINKLNVHQTKPCNEVQRKTEESSKRNCEYHGTKKIETNQPNHDATVRDDQEHIKALDNQCIAQISHDEDIPM